MNFTLPEIAEPLINTVCRVRRAEARRVTLDYAAFRRDVARGFEQIERACADADRTGVVEPLKCILGHFVETVVTHSNWLHAARWTADGPLKSFPATDFASAAHCARRLRSNDATAAEATELLTLLAVLGLDLQGSHDAGSSPGAITADKTGKIFTGAYKHTDRRDFRVPVAANMLRLAIVSVVAALCLFLINAGIFRVVARDILAAANELEQRAARR